MISFRSAIHSSSHMGVVKNERGDPHERNAITCVKKARPFGATHGHATRTTQPNDAAGTFS